MTNEQRMRKAHGEWCKAMAGWHKDKPQEWAEERHAEIAKANGIDQEEWRKWQNN